MFALLWPTNAAALLRFCRAGPAPCDSFGVVNFSEHIGVSLCDLAFAPKIGVSFSGWTFFHNLVGLPLVSLNSVAPSHPVP